MPSQDIVVIGASAGGVEALRRLVALLPHDIPAALFVVLHVPAHSPSVLPQILNSAGKLPARFARDGTPIEHGTVHVAPADHHLLLTHGMMRLSRGPRENRHRPAIDPLFRSAAWAYGPRTIGLVLSGTLDDGTAGLRAIKACGGTTMVQDPEEATYPEMPQNALAGAHVDYCAPLERLALQLTELARSSVVEADDYDVPAGVKIETEFALMERNLSDVRKLGPPSEFVCPTCHGSLWEVADGDMVRYRCHTGHAFSPQSLAAEQDEDLENSLYAALRAMDENAALARRIAKAYGGRFPRQSAEHLEKAERLERSARDLRRLLTIRNGKLLGGADT